MKFRGWILFFAACCLAPLSPVFSESFIAPNEHLQVDGVPPIPSAIADKVREFGSFSSAAMVAWHPRGGMVIRTRGMSTPQLFRVQKPGGNIEPVTNFLDAVSGGSFQPGKGEYLLFEKAVGGNEVFQIFRVHLSTGEVVAISPPGERASLAGWNRAGDRIVFSTTTVDHARAHTESEDDMPGEGGDRQATLKVKIADPLKPEEARTVATFEGGRFSGFRFSPDEKFLLMQESVSANQSHLWLLDIATGEKRRITPAPTAGATVYYGAAGFAADGKSLYALSDFDSEYRQLVRIDLETGKLTPLAPQFKYDVSEFSVSERARRIAFLTNEDGSSVLRFLNLDNFEELPRPALLPGVISGLHWGTEEAGSEKQNVLAFTMSTARAPGAVFAWNLDTRRLVRWTSGGLRGMRPADLAEPSLIRWKSFDDLSISGFLYRPDAERHPGKRPVVISIHGGPEGQSRPAFLGRSNYIVSELGVALIYPNVRGSSGFGKNFLALDNGNKREDAVKDIGALLDWIKEQPDLDANRVMVMGASYGGYMSLAVSTLYADRIVGAIDVVGISDFVTFLNNTESYRRDLRRAEYGDERDAEMRKYLQRISPLANAAKIAKPLFVVQGKNDPRVPYTEAVQIVAALKKQGTPVWFLMADDEGHGFARKANQDFLFYAELMFMEQTLLK